MAEITPYATAADVAAFLGKTEGQLPADIDTLLKRATEVIQSQTFSRVDMTDADQADIAKRACCAQVEYYIEQGTDPDLTAPVAGYSAGGVSMQYSGAANAELAPRAKRLLGMICANYRGASVR
jgi:hypothetical protein